MEAKSWEGENRFSAAAEQAFKTGLLDEAESTALLDIFHKMESAIVGVESLSRCLPPCPSLVNRVMAVALEPPRPNGRSPGSPLDDRRAPKAVPTESRNWPGEGTRGGSAEAPPEPSQSTGSPPLHQSHTSVLRNRNRRRSLETEGSRTGDALSSNHQENASGSISASMVDQDFSNVPLSRRPRTSSLSDTASGPAFPEEMDEHAATHSGLVCTAAERDALSRQMREGRRYQIDRMHESQDGSQDGTEDGEGEAQDVADKNQDLPGFPGWGPPALSEWLLLCENGGVAEESSGASPSSSSTSSTSRLPPHRLYVSVSPHGAARMATTIVAES